ncbi:hypothetical protein KAR91_42885, partial [Candidatus Pacearchaeota archaeon]|nr:hypothetical protein [Candidatus Pacearchaeota archaeon]
FLGHYNRIDVDKKAKIREYNVDGKRDSEIAKLLNISQTSVAYHLKKMGLLPVASKRSINRIGSDKARCSKCDEIRNISRFSYIKTKGTAYYSPSCRVCVEKQTNLRVNSSIDKYLQHRFIKLKAKCKFENIPLSINTESLLALYKNQKGNCFYTNQELEWGTLGNGSKLGKQLSIDKIIPELGYTIENVILCTRRANTVKNNLTLEEIEQWLPPWYEKIKGLPEFEMLKEASVRAENDS